MSLNTHTLNKTQKTISYVSTFLLVLSSLVILSRPQVETAPTAVTTKAHPLSIERAAVIATESDAVNKPKVVITSNQLTDSELIQVLENAGFSGYSLKQAWAIAKRESGGNASAFNGNAKTGDKSYGLFQINMIGDLGPNRRAQYGLSSNDALLNPNTNAKVAFKMSQGGTNWGAWDVGADAYLGGKNEPKYRYWMARYPG